MKMIKWSIDYVETWIIIVISCVTYAISGSEMKETLASCEIYGPNIVEVSMWTYVAHP
jgi:hypothetical protein